MTNRKVLSLFIVATAILLFSCASKPKADQDNQKILQEIENTEPETQNENEETVESVEETEKPESLEEKISDEENILPEIPEVLETTEPDYSEQTEPAVSEVPSVEQSEPETEDKTEKLEEKIDAKEEIVPPANTVISSEITDLKDDNSTPENKDTENPVTELKKDLEKQNQTEKENLSVSDSGNNEQAESVTDSSKTEEEITSDQEFTKQLEELKSVVPSRKTVILKNQFLDIVYPGTGWIYLGQTDGQKDFIFYGRKLGGKDTSFTLRSKNPGKYMLHFYKNDSLSGNYIDDYLEVEVLDKVSQTQEHLKAPSYAEAVPSKATITSETVKEERKKRLEELEAEKKIKADERKSSKSEEKSEITSRNSEIDESDSKGMTVIQTSSNKNERTDNSRSDKKETVPSQKDKKESGASVKTESFSENLNNLSTDELLKKARELYEQKDFVQAKKVLEKYFEKDVINPDEGLYLQGQILESRSPVQNIKGAIDSYDLIVKNYPASSFWQSANKRSIYLKRFYINIK